MKRRLAVVTTFSKAGFGQYAHRMVETWLKFWPKEVDLWVYPDEAVPLPKAVNLSSITDPIPAKERFLRKWEHYPIFNGGQPYDYRLDAVKFCHKPFALWDFAQRCDAGLGYDGFLWLDADTITHASVTDSALHMIAPEKHSIQFLGRSYKYTECGYLWFNLHFAEAREVLNAWVRLYKTGKFQEQAEWHDSYLFDVARNEVKPERAKDLTGHIPRESGGGHPFVNSVLGLYMDHHKGNARKATGKPRKNDLFVDHEAPYWRNNAHAKARRKPKPPRGA